MRKNQNIAIFSRHKHLFQKMQYVSCLLFAFTLPLNTQLSVYSFFLLIISWLLEGDFGFKWQRIAKNPLSWLFSGVYLLQVFGLFYTEDIDNGLFTLEKTAAILIFPLVLVSMKWQGKVVRSIFFVFVFGCLIAVVICVINAFFQLLFNDTIRFFFHHQFGSPLNLHAVYFSVYLVFSIALIWLSFLRKAFSSNNQKRIAGLVMICFYIIVILLSSRIIIPFLIIGSFLVGSFFIIKKGKIKYAISIFLLIVGSFIILSNSPEIGKRFQNIRNFDFKYRKGNSNGVTQRLVVWRCCIIIWQENALLGVGTGDAQENLSRCYNNINFQHGSASGYNAHSQYFDILIKLGAIGLVYFLGTLFIPLFIYRKDPLYIIFILLLSSFFVSEVALSRQQGVLFYTFFNSLICFSTKRIS